MSDSYFAWNSAFEASLIAAARADMIPAAMCGSWTVNKFTIAKPFPKPIRLRAKETFLLPAGTYTQLFCMTQEKMHLPPGDLVMQDTPCELATHLEFMRRAHGSVLITGLGLGCVARGCLANPAVTSVTIIERDATVMKLVAPYMPADTRLRLVVADAVEWCKTTNQTFDCAWHDLWSDPDKGEPNLAIIHTGMVADLRKKVGWQGAWQTPSWVRRMLRRRHVFGHA